MSREFDLWEPQPGLTPLHKMFSDAEPFITNARANGASNHVRSIPLAVRRITSAAADADHGKQIAERWCASGHLVQRGQTRATDQAPPFTYLAKTPEFDENKLAFLLLLPHPNMPSVSLNRAEVADLADYIRSLK